MTVDKAKKASRILEEIEELRSMVNKFRECNRVVIQGRIPSPKNDADVFTIDCVKEREESRYVKYIIDGLNNDIRELELSLERL